MTSRDRSVILGVLAVAAIVAMWLMVIQPKRDQAAKLGSKVTSVQSQLASARTEVAAGEASRTTFEGQYAELARLGEAVPQDDDVPSLIVQLQSAANGADVDFRSLQLTPSGSSPVSTTSTSQSVTAQLPPGAAVGPAGFPMEPFTFTFQGNFFHLAKFFRRLQSFVVATNKHVSVSGRLMTLNAISFNPGPSGFPQISASISATTYLVPASQGTENGATPSGPGSSSTTTVSGKSSSVAAPAVVTP
jgi:hypothetical protein